MATLLRDLVRFSRPHTIIATSLQVLTMWLIVVAPRRPDLSSAVLVGLTLSACLALNLFVVGVNQIVDVAIDRVNKPWLPLAAATMSRRSAVGISIGSGLYALLAAAVAGPYLLAIVTLIILIGSAYSLPPLHLKRFPIAAALSIALARGLLANVGLALHYGQVYGRPVPMALTILIGLFFFGFGVVIALYKDMPDAAGDRMYRIETFTTRLGPARVLGLGRLLLTACYALPITMALWQLPHPQAIYLLISHALLVAAFWFVSVRVDLTSQRSIGTFYLTLWALFYAEFAVLGLYAVTRSVA
jgi:homogentisate phytyltransferase/homogentisate geranylgeranyltransferase